MKKRIVWLITLAAALGLHASAEVVISSPTGTPDESDVALEKAVGAVKELPSDAVKVIADVVDYAGDEFRNTAHGVKSVFKGDTPREAVRDDMLTDVDTAWDISDEVLLRSYNITPAVMGEMVSEDLPAGEVVNVSSFFEGIDFRFERNFVVPAGGFVVLAPDFTAYRKRYPEAPIHGIYGGRLDNNGETVTLRDALGDVLFSVRYDDEYGWPLSPDGEGDALVLGNTFGRPSDPRHWRASTALYGSPGEEDTIP